MSYFLRRNLAIKLFNLQLITSLIPLLLLLVCDSSSSSSSSSSIDIHDLLPKYNLPIGLLPGNIKSYSISSKDNTFIVELTRHCYVHFQDQVAYYDTLITGKLDYGKVSKVSGIQAKKIFIWVDVDGMEVDQKSNTIQFHAGFFTQSMPAEAFQNIPICRQKGFLQSGFSSI